MKICHYVKVLYVNIMSKKASRNDIDISSKEITSRKYIEMTINSLIFGLRRIECHHQVDIELTCCVHWVVTYLRIHFNAPIISSEQEFYLLHMQCS